MTYDLAGRLHALANGFDAYSLTRGATHQEQYRYDVLGRLVDTTLRDREANQNLALYRAPRETRQYDRAPGAPWPATSPPWRQHHGLPQASYTVYDSLGRQWLNRSVMRDPEPGYNYVVEITDTLYAAPEQLPVHVDLIQLPLVGTVRW